MTMRAFNFHYILIINHYEYINSIPIRRYTDKYINDGISNIPMSILRVYKNQR